MSGAPNTRVNADSRGAAGGWPVLAVAALLILAALGAYWNSLSVPFLFDDNSSIGGNPFIRHLERIGDVLAPLTTGTTAGRPLLNLTFALNYAGGGLSVQGYHVVNLLIHICAGLALLGIVRRTLLLPSLRARYGEVALPLAACAALLWTLHPLQTESVTYISQRAESLMGLFYLLTFYGFIRAVPSVAGSDFTKGNEGNEAPGSVHGSLFSSLPSVKTPGSQPRGCANKSWLILSAAACFCGMATKQVMVTAPVLVLLYDRAFVSGSFRAALANRRWYYASLAVAWLWLDLLMHQSSLAAVNVGFHERVSWLTYALTELRVVTDYLKLAFWPHPLVFDYGSEILVTDPLAAAPYALVIGMVLIVVTIAWCKSPMAGFLGCWFFLILVPTSTVVPIAEQPMAENRMYLPLAAVVVLVTLLSYEPGRRRAFVVLGIVTVGFGVLTVGRNYDYRSELSIWEDTVARHPHTSRGHGNLGSTLATMPGRLPDAIAHYEAALRLKPDYAEAHNNLGSALATMPDRLPDAIAHYEAALRLRPDYADVHNNLAVVLEKIPGRLPEAIAHYEQALRIKPTYAEAQNNLAVALAKTPGRMPEAIGHYHEALRLDPDRVETRNNLAMVLGQMPGRMPDAIAHFEEALRLHPDRAQSHYDYAVALATIPGRLPDAIAHYETAVRLKPDFFEARNNLANALAKMPGRLSDAIAHYETAVRLRPNSVEAHYNFAMTLAKIPGRLPDAIGHFEEVVRLQPDFVDARNNLAIYYAQTGRLEAAIKQLEIAARLNPAATAIRDNLEQLKARRKR